MEIADVYCEVVTKFLYIISMNFKRRIFFNDCFSYFPPKVSLL
jgi:hypothetical protein